MTIPKETWHDVQVHVHHFLPSCPAVCQEQVDGLALKSGFSQGSIYLLGHPEDLPDGSFIQFRQQYSMLARHHQHMPGVHRADVHEGYAQLIGINEVSWCISTQDIAEDAGHGDLLRMSHFLQALSNWQLAFS
jgi:hypothetical protein